MRIVSLVLAIILILLVGLVILFEVAPDKNPKEDGEAGLLIVFFVIPFFGALGAFLLIIMSKEDKDK